MEGDPVKKGVFLLVTVSHAERTGIWSLGYLVNAYHVPTVLGAMKRTLLKQHKVSYNLKKRNKIHWHIDYFYLIYYLVSAYNNPPEAVQGYGDTGVKRNVF